MVEFNVIVPGDQKRYSGSRECPACMTGILYQELSGLGYRLYTEYALYLYSYTCFLFPIVILDMRMSCVISLFSDPECMVLL